MKFVKRCVIVLAMLFATQAFALEPGQEYKLLNPPQPTHSGKKIEVLEFFFYGCIHCYHLHPKLEAWVDNKMPKDVEITYVPVVFREGWESMANTYYALELMGKHTQKIDDALYNAWNRDNVDLSDEAKIGAYLAKYGVDSNKFREYYNSFTVETKVLRSKQMLQLYHIMGTPTLVVDGKYVIEGLEPDDTIKALTDVVNMVRRERGKG